MSSHHIVREKQEPALLVLGLEHFDDELLGQLLEWSPTVIVTWATAEKMDAAGIKIDVVIGEVMISNDIQSDVRYIQAFNHDVTEAALKYLVTHNYPAVNIITDALLLKDYVYFTDKINMVIYFGNLKVYPVASGFSKWKAQGEHIRQITHVAGIQTTGLLKVADDEYETAHDGFFTLQFQHPFIFIAETIS